MDPRKAISAINRAGALLVFPIDNKREPASLWSAFFPRTPMRWEWDESGDNRVGNLWHLRADLSTTRKVVYTKWYRGRATYLSRPLFTALLGALNPGWPGSRLSLSSVARQILDILDGESPLSTKEIKRMADLKGRHNEGAYNRALKELWSRLLIVAYGEVDDGAFPSLAIGSTRVIYEDLWRESLEPESRDAAGDMQVSELLSPENLFYRYFLKLRLQLQRELPVAAADGARAGGAQTRARPERRIPSVVRFDEL